MGTFTVAQYKTWTRSRLQNLTVGDAVLLQFANDANREIAGFIIPGMIWEFMVSNFAGTLTENKLRYDFQVNWRRPTDMTLTDPDNKALYPEFIEYAQYRQRYPDPTAGTTAPPCVWTTRGRTFLLGPTAPDQEYTLDMGVVLRPTTITGDGDTVDVPDDWSELMVLGMLKRSLELRRRYDQAQVIAQDLDPDVDNSLMAKMVADLMVPDGSVPTHMKTGWE